ncbi:RNA-directed DNA polymerase, eukaryota [Tanacetum coccineum]
MNRHLHDNNVKKPTDLQLAIHGVFIDGCWCTDPNLVKEAFHDHFEARFKKLTTNRLKLNFEFSKRETKSPGRWFSPLNFLGDIDFVWSDFCEAVNIFCNGLLAKGFVTKILANRLAMVIADIVSDTQSAFLADRQILDGPFILNEVLHWCKRKNKKAMFFKVDFAKAYDSVRWDYLMDVLEAFGFGPTCVNGFEVPRGVLKEMEAIRNHFFIGSDPVNKKITWIAWEKVLAAKIKGGLGVSSFHALNRASPQKGLEFVTHDWHDWIIVCVNLTGEREFESRYLEMSMMLLNVFAWRARRDCLPTRVQLIRRGVKVESSTCPVVDVRGGYSS